MTQILTYLPDAAAHILGRAWKPLCEERPFGDVDFGLWDYANYYLSILEDSFTG